MVEVSGRLGEGAAVEEGKLYSYVLSLDGEQTSGKFIGASRVSAVEAGRVTFHTAIDARKPAEGYLAVFEGAEKSAEPLGCWGYEDGELVWTPERG